RGASHLLAVVTGLSCHNHVAARRSLVSESDRLSQKIQTKTGARIGVRVSEERVALGPLVRGARSELPPTQEKSGAKYESWRRDTYSFKHRRGPKTKTYGMFPLPLLQCLKECRSNRQYSFFDHFVNVVVVNFGSHKQASNPSGCVPMCPCRCSSTKNR